MSRATWSWLSPSDEHPFILAPAVASSALRRADPPTTGVDTIVLGDGDDTLPLTADVVNAGDSFDGAGGKDLLLLTGGGTFDFSDVTLAGFEALETDGSDTSIVFADLEQAALLLGGAGLTGANDVVSVVDSDFVDIIDVVALFDLGAETVHLVTPFFLDAGPFDFAFTPGSEDGLVRFSGVDVSPGGASPYATITGEIDAFFGAFTDDLVATTDTGVVYTYGFCDCGNLTSLRIDDGPGNEFRFVSRTVTYDRFRLDTRVLELDDGRTITTEFHRDAPQLVTREAPDGSLTVIVVGRQGDTLTGSDFDDRLVGGRRGDVLIGGAGGDVMTGGRGGDVFDLTGGGRDVITDFAVAEDALHIDGVAGLVDLTAVTARAYALLLETAGGDVVRLTGLGAEDAAQLVFV